MPTKTYTKADLVKAWQSGYEEGYQDALIDNYGHYRCLAARAGR